MQTGPPQPAEDPDHPLQLEDHYQGHCKGRNTATCLDYMDLVGRCMDPLKGYRMKLLGDRIEHDLKSEKLSASQRSNLKEDLAAAREAERNKSDEPAIAGEPKSQRYLSDISDEFTKQSRGVMAACQQKARASASN